jgi:hypothetical protein
LRQLTTRSPACQSPQTVFSSNPLVSPDCLQIVQPVIFLKDLVSDLLVSSAPRTSNVDIGSFFGSAFSGTCLTRRLGSCRVLADAEGAKRAFAFTTGMAALAVVTHLVSAGVCPDPVSCNPSLSIFRTGHHTCNRFLQSFLIWLTNFRPQEKRRCAKGQLFTLICDCRLVLLLCNSCWLPPLLAEACSSLWIGPQLQLASEGEGFYPTRWGGT